MNELRHVLGRRPIFGHIGLICCIACLGAQTAYSADPPVYEIKPKKVIEVNRDPKWLAFSDDGKRLAASEGTRAWVWDTASGEKLLELSATGGRWAGGRVALSPDGSRLVISTAAIRLLDVESGKVEQLVKGRLNQVTVAFSPDGKTLASTADRVEGVKLWETSTLKDLERFQIDIPRPVEGALAFSPNGKILAVANERNGYDGGEMRVLDVESGKEIRRLRAKENAVGSPIALAFSMDGRFIALGHEKNAISIWEVETGRAVWDLTWPSVKETKLGWDGVSSLMFTFDSQCLIATCPDNRVRVWEMASGKERYEVIAHSSRGVTAHGCPLVAMVVDAQGWRQIALWDPRTVEPKQIPVQFPNPEEAWSDLGADDAGRAYRTMRHLAAFPKETVTMFEKRLAEYEPAKRGEIERRIAELDDDSFEVRGRAKQRLAELGMSARTALLAARGTGSPEVKKSIEELLDGLLIIRDSHRLRLVRAAELLGWIDSADSDRLLERLLGTSGHRDRKREGTGGR